MYSICKAVRCNFFFLSFLFCPLLPARCRCRGLLFLLMTLNGKRARTHTHTNLDIQQDSSGRGIGPSQTPLPGNIQHSQETHIHASSEFRTRYARKQAATDPHVRPCGHRDWRIAICEFYLHPAYKCVYRVMRVKISCSSRRLTMWTSRHRAVNISLIWFQQNLWTVHTICWESIYLHVKCGFITSLCDRHQHDRVTF